MSGTEKLDKFVPPTEDVDPGNAKGAGTQKMDKFVLPTEPAAAPIMSAEAMEAVVEAAFERELRESQRMQAAEPPVEPPVEAKTPSPPPPPPEPAAAAPAEAKKEPEAEKNDPDQLRTALAKKFVSLADDVNEAFGDFHIGGGDYVVELTHPQGPSTGGGRQSLQHLRLRPRRPGYPVIVGGSVDGVNKRADLRDFAYVHIVHTLRFESPLDLNEAEWEQFLRKAEVVLKQSEITTRRIPPPRDLLQQASAKKISRPMLAAFIVVTVLASFVVWRVLLVLLHPR